MHEIIHKRHNIIILINLHFKNNLIIPKCKFLGNKKKPNR